MPTIEVLPHAELCPEGRTFEAKSGMSLLDNLLEQGIEVEHACEKSCACTTCHVIVRKGYDTLPDASEDEEDLLDRRRGRVPPRLDERHRGRLIVQHVDRVLGRTRDARAAGRVEDRLRPPPALLQRRARR